MIIRCYGVVELLATLWMLTALVTASPQNETQQETNNILATAPQAEKTTSENSTTFDSIDGDTEKSERRAALFDTAESSPWVRVYNRQGGTNGFNYETRGNTSAHTSGGGWDLYRTNSKNVVLPVDRRESKVRDILRVKTKENGANVEATKKKDDENSADDKAVTTNEQLQSSSSSSAEKNDTKEDNIPKNKLQPSVDNLLPKDGTNWKVIGEGGDDGWQVIGDKGDVEWKIEYDDGEWKVTSTGDVPVDAEFVDPDYVWGPADGSIHENDEYNSWAADDYAYNPWVDPGAYGRGVANHSWPSNENDGVTRRNSSTATNSAATSRVTSKEELQSKETVKFGERRKTPEKDSMTAQNRNDEQSDSADDDKRKKAAEQPRTSQNIVKAKSWNSVQPAGNIGPQWVQEYGTKTWEVDNTGWNSGFGGETWVPANKEFPGGAWVPKSTTGIQDTSSNSKIDNDNPNAADNPIRGWGTGYGTKTWKGNEWDSNVVWKTSGPWASAQENNTWLFPDQDNNDDSGGKTIVWSQPVPDQVGPSQKQVAPPTRSGVKIKWPTRPSSALKTWSTTPGRRTEEESWGDDSSEGGVVWKVQTTDGADDSSSDSSPENDSNQGWDWNATPQVAPTWKENAPPKTSQLISVKWKPDETSPLAPSPPPVWNQGQWFGGDQSSFPYWMFGGCKVAIKCGSKDGDTKDDGTDRRVPPDTSYETSQTPTEAPPTTLAQAWPVKQFVAKSWGPPPKNWRPPQPNKGWKIGPTKSWRPPKNIKKQTSPPPTPTVTETPTPTFPWTEPTPPATISWPVPPPPKKKQWKQRRPNKSWKPPPTKSWRPPRNKNWRPPPTKSWKPPATKTWNSPPPAENFQPSIATPAPDMWTNTAPTKPDCKEDTWPTQAPDTDDDSGPPQVIIITKLPGNTKTEPTATDKGDTKDDSKKVPPGKSWVFPPRKGYPKGGKNRRDKVNSSQWPARVKASGQVYNPKGWPRGMPPQYFGWPGNNKRRWTTRRPPVPNWIPPKYMKSKGWRQAVKKWMSG